MIIDSRIPVEVDINDITDDEQFKVSKKIFQNTLPASLKQSGMLEVPFVVKKERGYQVLTCHNRIKLIRESGVKTIKCFVLEQPSAKIFMNYVSLKAYRNELGPFGKLKALTLLRSPFNLDETAVKEFCTRILKLNSEIIENENYLSGILSFPDELISFIDEKDLNFRVLKDLSLLPADWIIIVNKWIKQIQVRVNIFRMLIDYLFDIYRRGGDISLIESVSFSDDKTLYDSIYRIRYPEYSKLKRESEILIGGLSAPGLTIEFPEYFDRRTISIKVEIDKKSDCAAQLKRVSEIDAGRLTKLLSLL